MTFSDFFTYENMAFSNKNQNKSINWRKLTFSARAKQYINLQIEQWISQQKWLWMYSPHFPVLHFTIPVNAITNVKRSKNQSMVLDFKKNWLRMGRKRKKWSNFAKNGKKLPITQNGQDGFFSSDHIRN